MSISFFNTIDVLFFSCIILLVIIIHTLVSNDNLSLSAKTMILLAVSTFIICFCDIIARLDLPFDKQINHYVIYLADFIYMLLQPLPVSLGVMYLFSLFREKPFSLRSRILFLIPFFVGSLLMIYSVFTDFIFRVDADNIYHRGPGMFLYAFINYSFILPAIGLLFYHRDIIKKQMILTIIYFTLIPCLGSFLQLRYYGIVTAWPTFTISLLIIYIFQERRRSDRDYLTGLLNRQSFDAKIYGRIEQYSRKGAFALVMIDLDKFKKINDQYGHDKGDEILQAAGFILSHSVSASDTVARYGGDEFVLIIEATDKIIIEKIITRIHQNVANWNRKNEMPGVLSLSAGYVIYDPVQHKSYEDLFRLADSIMFEKKKNPVRV